MIMSFHPIPFPTSSHFDCSAVFPHRFLPHFESRIRGDLLLFLSFFVFISGGAGSQAGVLAFLPVLIHSFLPSFLSIDHSFPIASSPILSQIATCSLFQSQIIIIIIEGHGGNVGSMASFLPSSLIIPSIAPLLFFTASSLNFGTHCDLRTCFFISLFYCFGILGSEFAGCETLAYVLISFPFHSFR
jgi:hypothetical protein